ncbi:TIGR03086 family metal-binding protein [Actinoplanes sp. TRM 88003]|uniref:TIGR03086 family metal-binding protein n=1 Tax=Paractinoplanes aksuensis TaxID=2939490 RepID=A0ABT1DGJ7_9ACTN|nr:TIGR03086 family metal-binding protein [Actinoplanes aksuensis]MCO8269196.1 TIGR03086 family metal-binding protein [Actinoplanes aksuensis]
MNLPDIMDRAFAATTKVVRDVDPGQLGAPTPCTEWDVRTLLNHLLLVAEALESAGRGEPVPDEHWAGTATSDFGVRAQAATTAWAVPAAWDRPVRMGAMPMPAPLAVSMLVSDVVIHGWDLARATGQHFGCDDDVAEMALGFLTGMGDQGRAMGIFAAEVEVGEDASVLDRVVALSGRRPADT